MSLLFASIVKWAIRVWAFLDRSSQFHFLELGILDFLISCFDVLRIFLFRLFKVLFNYLFGQLNQACWVKTHFFCGAF